MNLRRFNSLYDDFFQEGSTKPQEVKKVLNNLDQLDKALLDSQTPTPLPDLKQNIGKVVVGQEAAIEALQLAFKRPFYRDHPQAILNTILLCGPKGSGKHTLLQTFANELYTKQQLSTNEISYIDLNTIDSEQTLVTDLYSSFQKPRSIIVFENIHLANPIYINMLASLCSDQQLALKNRYVQANNSTKLTHIGSNLEQHIIKTLTPKQHYFIFLSPLSLSKTKHILGNQFLNAIVETIETTPLQTTDCLRILKKDLLVLENSILSHFQCQLHFTKEALTFIAESYSKVDGYYAITKQLEDLHQNLSNFLLQEKHPKLDIECRNQTLYALQTPLLKTENHDALALEVQKEIEALIGLESVKQYLFKLKDMVLVKKMREEQGLKTADVSMHMIFSGNPGTGKTTMARLMAQYLKALGVLRNGQLVEVTRADLVANYVGQTATKTRNVIESSLGGVLFIDEAYSLYRGKEDSFGLEAIDMLVKGMEDYRDDFIVVLAGYTKEMGVFLEANSGLKSRFSNIIEFENYTGEELYQIANNIALSKEYIIDASLEADLIAYFNQEQALNASTSGNGRLARNVVEDAILCQASRISNNPQSDLQTLIKEDFKIL